MSTDALDDPLADEARLVLRAQSGDTGAYGTLVARHQQAAFRVAYVLLGSADDAQDAAQEGFVKAYVALGRFRAGEPLRPWLLRIVGNEARNRLRSRRRAEGLLGRVMTALRGEAEPSPESVLVRTESGAEVRAAIGRLRDEDRLVVTCRYLLELTEAETAATLGIPSGTVKSRLHRGLARLRAELAEAPAVAEGGS